MTMKSPKWYVPGSSRGYHGASQVTILWKQKKMQQTLETVPMQKIESYFVDL
jgi:hypothetical protein